MSNRAHLTALDLVKVEHEAAKAGWYKKYPYKCFCQEAARRSVEMGGKYLFDRTIRAALRMLREIQVA